MFVNSLLLALREVRRNLLRSFLTMLGVVIGVSAVITMVTLGNGATEAVKKEVSSLGSNLLMLRPGQRMGPGGSSGGAPFDNEDADAIANSISGLAAVAPEVNRSAAVVYTANNWSSIVTGTTNDYFTAASWEFASGRAFTDAEQRFGQMVCIVGATIVRELFDGSDPIGENLRIKNFSCQVIGVLASKGQASMGRDQDDTVVMPIRAVQRRLTGSRDVNSIRVSVRDESAIDSTKQQLLALMRERRHIGANKDDNFNVLDTRQIVETLSSTTHIMTLLLGAVASVSLLVGGIGIMNIMLVSVTERTREIGIRLAIGALENEVLLQFLIEAVVLAALGGLMGVILATVLSLSLTALMDIPYAFNVAINLQSFLFSAAIGVIFGYVPARRAAKLDPINALRHE